MTPSVLKTFPQALSPSAWTNLELEDKHDAQ